MQRFDRSTPRPRRLFVGAMIVGVCAVTSCSASDDAGSDASDGGDVCSRFEAIVDASASIEEQISDIGLADGIATDGEVDEAGAAASEEAADAFEEVADDTIGLYNDLADSADGQLADDLAIVVDASETLLDGIVELLRDIEPGTTQEQLGENFVELLGDVDPELTGATERVAQYSIDECGIDFAEV